MDILANIIAFSIATQINLMTSENATSFPWTLLVVEREEKLTWTRFMEPYEQDQKGASHREATDVLRALENKDGFDVATVTYDATLKINGERSDAIIVQIFSLDTYADRRVAQKYSLSNGNIQFIGEPQIYNLSLWGDDDISKNHELFSTQIANQIKYHLKQNAHRE